MAVKGFGSHLLNGLLPTSSAGIKHIIKPSIVGTRSFQRLLLNTRLTQYAGLRPLYHLNFTIATLAPSYSGVSQWQMMDSSWQSEITFRFVFQMFGGPKICMISTGRKLKVKLTLSKRSVSECVMMYVCTAAAKALTRTERRAPSCPRAALHRRLDEAGRQRA